MDFVCRFTLNHAEKFFNPDILARTVPNLIKLFFRQVFVRNVQSDIIIF